MDIKVSLELQHNLWLVNFSLFKRFGVKISF